MNWINNKITPLHLSKKLRELGILHDSEGWFWINKVNKNWRPHLFKQPLFWNSYVFKDLWCNRDIGKCGFSKEMSCIKCPVFKENVVKAFTSDELGKHMPNIITVEGKNYSFFQEMGDYIKVGYKDVVENEVLIKFTDVNEVTARAQLVIWLLENRLTVEHDLRDLTEKVWIKYPIEDMISYLNHNRELMGVLNSGIDIIEKILSEEKKELWLELHHDPEEGWDKLFIVIKGNITEDKEVELYEKWYKNLPNIIRTKLNYTVEDKLVEINY